MESFNFTHKKFQRLTLERQQKWIINWLSSLYDKLCGGDLSEENLKKIFSDYSRIMEWSGEPGIRKPDSMEPGIWFEFLSNRVDYHRKKIGIYPRDHDLLPHVRSDDSTTARESLIPYHIALDGLRSLFNVGSIFRLCDGAGLSSVILGNVPGKEDPRVLKTSMGSAEWIPQKKCSDLTVELEEMKIAGNRIIGIETVDGSEKYYDYNWPEKGVIVFGNEEFGLTRSVMTVCDDFVHIPLLGRKNSINVANSVSVIAFHLSKIFSNE